MRGYRTNQILADRGGVVSFEYGYALGRRLQWEGPVLEDLSVSAFIDAGYGENVVAPFAGKHEIGSVGVALSTRLTDGIDLTYFVASNFTKRPESSTDSFQDNQMGFRLTARLW